jgi:hypothetical protein
MNTMNRSRANRSIVPNHPRCAAALSGAFAFGVAMFAGCGDPRPSAPLPPDGGEIAVRRQFIRNDSREDRAFRVVIRNRRDWAALPLLDVPIDFDTEMALVVAMGRRIGKPYSLRVGRVWRDNRQIRVELVPNEQDPDAAATVAAPFAIAIIDRCDLNVEGFKEGSP